MGTENNARTRSQNEKILAYMKMGTSITPRVARELFGCERLASRICDLKKKGYVIKKTMVHRLNQEGTPVKFAEYSLEVTG